MRMRGKFFFFVAETRCTDCYNIIAADFTCSHRNYQRKKNGLAMGIERCEYIHLSPQTEIQTEICQLQVIVFEYTVSVTWSSIKPIIISYICEMVYKVSSDD